MFIHSVSALALGAVSLVAAEPRAAAAGGRGGTAAPSGFSGAGKSAGSPQYNYMFQFPVPIPQIAQPDL